MASSSVKEEVEDDAKDHPQSMLLAPIQQNPGDAIHPHEPMQGAALTEDRWWELFYDIYDSFLIAIAVVLLVKTSLCVYAYNKDKYSRGLSLDAVSRMTVYLIRFNEQVGVPGQCHIKANFP